MESRREEDFIEKVKEIETSLEKATAILEREAVPVTNVQNLQTMLYLLDVGSNVLADVINDRANSSQLEKYEDHLNFLQLSLDLQKRALSSFAPPTCSFEPQGGLQDRHKLLEALRRTVQPENGLNSVVGLIEAKQLLTDAVVLPLRYHHLFTGARKPWSSVLLYGPPGTGKTHLAHAVAAEVGAEFYVVTPADLLSKWFGETEQKIRDLFGLIKERARTQCCIVFLDEVDALCRRRTDGEAESTRRMKTELLTQLQEQTTKSERPGQLFFLCATNCPWEIDSAFLRRFQRRIFISLPDRVGRHNIIRNLSGGASSLELTDAEWEQLLDRTEGFSGSDLADLVKGALYQPVRELSSATHWVPGPGFTWIPCSSNRIGAVRRELKSFPPKAVCARNVTVIDFLTVIANTHPTVCQEDLQRYDMFTNQFGQLG